MGIAPPVPGIPLGLLGAPNGAALLDGNGLLKSASVPFGVARGNVAGPLQQRSLRGSSQALRAQGYRNSEGGNVSNLNLTSTGSINVCNARQLGSNNTPVALAGLVVEFNNWLSEAGNPFALGTVPYNVEVFVEAPLNTLIAQFTFGGQQIGTVPAPVVGSVPNLFTGASLVSDLLPIYIPAGTTYWIRIQYTVAAGQTTAALPGGSIPLATLNEGYLAGATANFPRFTLGLSNFGTPGTGAGPGYYGLYGLTAADMASVQLLGDSLIRGRGDDPTGLADGFDAIGNGGPYARAMESFPQFGQIRNCKSGSLARDWASIIQTAQQGGTAAGTLWRTTLKGTSTIIVQLGTNDLDLNILAPTIWNYLMDIYVAAAAAGCQVIPCTIPPRTNSTDGWTSLVGQSVTLPSNNNNAYQPGPNSDMGILNNNIRNLPNQYPWCPGIIDGSDVVSTGRDSGFWKYTPVPWTKDGTHWVGQVASGSALVGIPQVEAAVVAALSQKGMVV